MASQPVRRAVSLTARPDAAFDAVLELRCGCTLARTVPVERTVLLESGERRVVGKYVCPNGHAVGG